MPDSKLYRIICLIANSEIADKSVSLLSLRGIEVSYRTMGKGTASSEVMNMLGLGTTEKIMIAAMASKETASSLLPELRKRLYLGMPNTGIAFTIPVSGGPSNLFENIERSEAKSESDRSDKMEDRDFSMIIAIVNQGYSDAVMDAARSAGATGGTVFHSRRIENNIVGKSFWNILIQGEREIVMILARNSRKMEIMKAINDSCGIDSESNGVVFSVPIADVEGLG